MTRHPTVALLYTPPPDSEAWPWGPGTQPRLVDIDEGIAGLIAELWQAGIDTVQCCQGGPVRDLAGAVIHMQKAVVCFGSQDDARRFMRIILAARRHMLTRRPVDFDRWTAEEWHQSIHWHYGDNPSVLFPHDEIPEVEARVRWWRRWAPAPWYQQRLEGVG